MKLTVVDGGVKLLKLSLVVTDGACKFTRRFLMMLRAVPVGSSNVSDPVDYLKSRFGIVSISDWYCPWYGGAF